MTRTLNTRISPASVLALISLFVSLGSVSYAASMIGTANLKNGAVTKKKLRRNAVGTLKIKNEAVTGLKVNEATLGKVPSAANADQADQADSAVKAQSATSAQTAASVGPNGVDSAALQSNSVGSSELQTNSTGASELQTGSVGPSELGFASVRSSDLGPIVVRSEVIAVNSGASRFLATDCLNGERMLSGGASWGGGGLEAAAPNLRIAYSYPLGTDLWAARGYNVSGIARNFIVYALCLAN